MAPSLISTYLAFSLLCLFSVIKAGATNPNPPFSFSFSFQNFDKNRTFALQGDAEIGNSTVRILSKGLVVYEKPIRFFGTHPGFSTHFAFSLPSGYNGETLAFLLVPMSRGDEQRQQHRIGDSPALIAVRFVTDPNGGHIEIEIGDEISIKSSSNLSAVGLVLNIGQELHSWIRYSGVSKTVQVWITKSRVLRPSTPPLLSCTIDLSNVLWREAMYVRISSSQLSSVYSWSFRVNHGDPYLMHSIPLDPRSVSIQSRQDPMIIVRRRSFKWTLMALLVGAVCGSLMASVMLAVLCKALHRHQVAPLESPVIPVGIGYEKIVVDGGKVEDEGFCKV